MTKRFHQVVSPARDEEDDRGTGKSGTKAKPLRLARGTERGGESQPVRLPISTFEPLPSYPYCNLIFQNLQQHMC